MSVAELMGCRCPAKPNPKDPYKGAPKRLEKVKDAAGEVVALRCTNCTAIECLVGACDGCDMPGVHLSYVVEAGGEKRYYHSEDCGIAHAKKLGKAKAGRIAAFKASQTKIPGCE